MTKIHYKKCLYKYPVITIVQNGYTLPAIRVVIIRAVITAETLLYEWYLCHSKSRSTLVYDMVPLQHQYIATAFLSGPLENNHLSRTHTHSHVHTHTLILYGCCPPADVESLPSKRCICTETQSHFCLVAYCNG